MICKICLKNKKPGEFYFRKDSKKHRSECSDCFGKEHKSYNFKYKKTDKYKQWKKEYDIRYHKTETYKKYNNSYGRKYRKIEKNKERQFLNNLRKYWPEYSTEEARFKYESLLIFQDGKCAICENKESRRHNGVIRKLCVDHCHLTGIVRGLLCSRCNITIGRFEDSADLLLKASKYLTESPKGLK